MPGNINPIESTGRCSGEERAAMLLETVRDKFNRDIVPVIVAKHEHTPTTIGLFLITDSMSEVAEPYLIYRRDQFEDILVPWRKGARLIVIDSNLGKLGVDIEVEAVPALDFYEQLKSDELLVDRRITRLHESTEGLMLDEMSVGMIEDIETSAPSEPSVYDRLEPIIRDFASAPFRI